MENQNRNDNCEFRKTGDVGGQPACTCSCRNWRMGCTNEECGWEGGLSETTSLSSIADRCPKCGHVAEPIHEW